MIIGPLDVTHLAILHILVQVVRNNNVYDTFDIRDYNLSVNLYTAVRVFKRQFQKIIGASNLGSSAGTLKHQIYYDPDAFNAGNADVTTTYYHEANGVTSGSGVVRLINIDNSIQLSGSNVSADALLVRSSAVTMPSEAKNIDSNVVTTGTINATRIIINYIYIPVFSRRRSFFNL